MNTSRLIIAAALLALTGTAIADDRQEKNEARLAERLKGRTAGEPVACISTFKSTRLQVIDRVALVYDAGDTLYVARPTDPDMLREDDIVVIERFGGQLCHTDVVRTVDRMSGFVTGVVFLGKFVPYKKQE